MGWVLMKFAMVACSSIIAGAWRSGLFRQGSSGVPSAPRSSGTGNPKAKATGDTGNRCEPDEVGFIRDVIAINPEVAPSSRASRRGKSTEKGGGERVFVCRGPYVNGNVFLVPLGFAMLLSVTCLSGSGPGAGAGGFSKSRYAALPGLGS